MYSVRVSIPGNAAVAPSNCRTHPAFTNGVTAAASARSFSSAGSGSAALHRPGAAARTIKAYLRKDLIGPPVAAEPDAATGTLRHGEPDRVPGVRPEIRNDAGRSRRRAAG